MWHMWHKTSDWKRCELSQSSPQGPKQKKKNLKPQTKTTTNDLHLLNSASCNLSTTDVSVWVSCDQCGVSIGGLPHSGSGMSGFFFLLYLAYAVLIHPVDILLQPAEGPPIMH